MLLTFLAERCSCIASSAIDWHKMLSVVCHRRRLSVTRVYCDKTAEAEIMQFSLKCSEMRLTLRLPSLIAKFEGFPLIGGPNWGEVVSDFAILYLGNGARQSLANN